MAVTFTKLTQTFAAEVHGVDIAAGVWDNRCCLHRGRTWDKARYRRVMHRTTVAGIGPTAE